MGQVEGGPLTLTLTLTLSRTLWAQVKADQSIEVTWQQEVAVTTYCVLVLLWLINWVAAIAWASMSCAVAYWFTYDNAPGAEHQCCKTGTGLARLASATWTITSKHLGSLAVGALVITNPNPSPNPSPNPNPNPNPSPTPSPTLALALALTLTRWAPS